MDIDKRHTLIKYLFFVGGGYWVALAILYIAGFRFNSWYYGANIVVLIIWVALLGWNAEEYNKQVQDYNFKTAPTRMITKWDMEVVVEEVDIDDTSFDIDIDDDSEPQPIPPAEGMEYQKWNKIPLKDIPKSEKIDIEGEIGGTIDDDGNLEIHEISIKAPPPKIEHFDDEEWNEKLHEVAEKYDDTLRRLAESDSEQDPDDYNHGIIPEGEAEHLKDLTEDEEE